MKRTPARRQSSPLSVDTDAEIVVRRVGRSSRLCYAVTLIMISTWDASEESTSPICTFTGRGAKERADAMAQTFNHAINAALKESV